MTIETTNTEATQPDTTPTDVVTVAAVADGGEGTGVADGAAPVDLEAKAVDAFSKGVEEATDPDATPPARDAADVAAQAQAAGQAAPAAVDPAKPAGEAKAAPGVTATQPDPVLEAEIKDLHLKAKAADRFREMSSALKVKDAEIEPLKVAQQQLEEWNGFLAQSTVSPQQLGAMMEVGKALNGNDITKKAAAFDTMLSTLVDLGKQIGREVPGLVDPLDAHPDLKAAVENGDITAELAKQQAQQRAVLQHNQQATTQQNEQQQHAQAQQQATNQLFELGQVLRNGDAARGVLPDPFFEMKMQMLAPTLDIIQANLPPQQWAAAAAQAYGRLPQQSAPVAMPAAQGQRGAPPVGHMPIRPAGAAAGIRPKPRSDEEAFAFGAYGAPQ